MLPLRLTVISGRKPPGASERSEERKGPATSTRHLQARLEAPRKRWWPASNELRQISTIEAQAAADGHAVRSRFELHGARDVPAGEDSIDLLDVELRIVRAH